MKITISKSKWNEMSKSAAIDPQYLDKGSQLKETIIQEVLSDVLSKVNGLFEFTIDKKKLDGFKNEFSNLMQQYLVEKLQPKYFSDEQLNEIAKKRKEIYENKTK